MIECDKGTKPSLGTWHVSGGGGGDARGTRGLGIVEALGAYGQLQAVPTRDWVRHVVLLVAVKAVVRTEQGGL